MHIRAATVYEVSEFIAESLKDETKGCESDHQDEYLGAMALETSLGTVVELWRRDGSVRHVHVTGLNVEDHDFFINLRSELPKDE